MNSDVCQNTNMNVIVAAKYFMPSLEGKLIDVFLCNTIHIKIKNGTSIIRAINAHKVTNSTSEVLSLLKRKTTTKVVRYIPNLI